MGTRTTVDAARHLTVPVAGMTCGSCETRVRKALIRLPGVQAVTVSATRASATLSGPSLPPRDRIDAAIRLKLFPPTAALVAAVSDGVRDPEYLVRYHCANTLLRWAGRTEEISEHDLFALILDDAGEVAWADAAARLAAVVPLPV